MLPRRDDMILLIRCCFIVIDDYAALYIFFDYLRRFDDELLITPAASLWSCRRPLTCRYA